MERISREASNRLSVGELMQFLNISNTDRKDELQAILNAAICKVEDIINKSLTSQEIKIIGEDEIELLLAPIDKVLSVTDYKGNAISYELDLRNILTASGNIIVTYTTIPNDELINDYKSYVYEYAGLIYDGETDKTTIDGVLSKIPRSIC